MARGSYLDFDLLIDQSSAGYRAQILDAPAGVEHATGEFVLPFDEKDVKILLLSLGQPRRSVRRLESPHTEEAKKFGGQLFNAVFTKDLWASLRRSLEVAQEQNAGLRIRLQLTRDAQSLADLPWEYLYDAGLNRFLALSTDTPVTRYLALPEPVRPLSIRPPLRVLVMISAPSDYTSLDVEREWSLLQEALQDVTRDGLVVAERLEKPTLAHLQRRLRRNQYHIFHFIGHGAFDESTDDGVVLLEDDAGRGRPVSGQELGTLLHDHRSLRLTIINACEGARSSRLDPFAGTAQSLVQQGIPAVIAMQFEISDEAAIAFSHEFYGALSDGFPVDGALAEARKAIYAAVPDVEWGTPVLFMRSPDGRVFDVNPANAPTSATAATAAPAAPAVPAVRAEPQEASAKSPVRGADPSVKAETAPADPKPAVMARPDLEALHTQALAHFYTDHWPEAVAAFEQILSYQPAYPGVAAKLAHAKLQQDLTGYYVAAQEALTAGNWGPAVEELESLTALDAGYRDTVALLANARKQRDLAGLYEEARRLCQARAWQAIPRIFEKIHAQEAAYPDIDGLLATALSAIAAADLERKVHILYTQAVLDIDRGLLSEAVVGLEEVAALSPDHQQTATLLAHAREMLAAEQEAQARASEAQRRQALSDQFAVAFAHFEAARWGEAVQGLWALLAAEAGYVDPVQGPAVDLLAKAQEMKELSALPKPPARGPKPSGPGEQAGGDAKSGSGRPKPTSLPR